VQLPVAPVEYEPHGHSCARPDVDPAGHACPGAHTPLHAALLRPGAAPKVPAGHGSHTPPDASYLEVVVVVGVGVGVGGNKAIISLGHTPWAAASSHPTTYCGL
jgi:hypothetical protein